MRSARECGSRTCGTAERAVAKIVVGIAERVTEGVVARADAWVWNIAKRCRLEALIGIGLKLRHAASSRPVDQGRVAG